jgi:hypothetical protein
MKHAVFGPFSNEAREKSSISRLKARARFEKDTKKAPEPQVPAPVGGRHGGRKNTKTQKVRALPPVASSTCLVTQRAFGPARNDTTSAMSRTPSSTAPRSSTDFAAPKSKSAPPRRLFSPQSQRKGEETIEAARFPMKTPASFHRGLWRLAAPIPILRTAMSAALRHSQNERSSLHPMGGPTDGLCRWFRTRRP